MAAEQGETQRGNLPVQTLWGALEVGVYEGYRGARPHPGNGASLTLVTSCMWDCGSAREDQIWKSAHGFHVGSLRACVAFRPVGPEPGLPLRPGKFEKVPAVDREPERSVLGGDGKGRACPLLTPQSSFRAEASICPSGHCPLPPRVATEASRPLSPVQSKTSCSPGAVSAAIWPEI